MDTITLLIAGICPVFRGEFQDLLTRHAELRLVGSCTCRTLQPRRVAELQPDILVFHIRRLDALALNKLAKVCCAATRVVVSTAGPVAEPIVAEALSHHVLHGLLTHADPLETYLKAVRAVAAGEIWISRKVLQRMVYTARRGPVPGPTSHSETPVRLTEREHEIRGLIIEGLLSDKAIGKRLGISDKTVKRHIFNIMRKLQVHRRVQLLLRLRKQGR